MAKLGFVSESDNRSHIPINLPNPESDRMTAAGRPSSRHRGSEIFFFSDRLKLPKVPAVRGINQTIEKIRKLQCRCEGENWGVSDTRIGETPLPKRRPLRRRRPGEPALGPQTGFTTSCSNGLVLAGGLCGY